MGHVKRRTVLRSIALLGLVLGLSTGHRVHAQARTGTGGSGGGFTGGSGGGGGFSGGSGGGFSGSSGGGFSGGSGGGGGFSGSSGSGFSGSSGSSFAGAFGGSGGTGTAGSGARGTTGGSSPTNFLSSSYANPFYQGRPGASVGTTSQPGGFGQPSFGTVSTTGTTGLGTTGLGGLGGASGTMTRFGGSGGLGGSGTNRTAGQTSLDIPSNTRMTYMAAVRFPSVPAPVQPRFQTEVRSVLDRSTSIRRPGDIAVDVEGQTVVLRGRVATPDEARLAEGLVRLTPGVRVVRNELRVE